MWISGAFGAEKQFILSVCETKTLTSTAAKVETDSCHVILNANTEALTLLGVTKLLACGLLLYVEKLECHDYY